MRQVGRDSDNEWISDSHKALKEPEPKAEPAAASAPPSPPNISQGLADWVKRMGGTLGPKPDAGDGGPTGFVSPLLDGSQAGVVKCVFGNGPVSISRAQITAADWPLRIIKS